MISEFNYTNPDQAVAAIILQAEKDRQWMRRVVQYAPVPEMFTELKGLLTYADDPNGIELIQRPRTLLSNLNELGAPGRGDCDDFTTLAVSAAMAYNIPARIVLAGRSKKTPVHVYAQLYDNFSSKWYDFDLTAPEVDTIKYYPYKQIIDVIG